MLSADAADLIDQSGPMSSFIFDEGEDGKVFLDGPSSPADVRVEVIEPMFAALLGGLVELSF